MTKRARDNRSAGLKVCTTCCGKCYSTTFEGQLFRLPFCALRKQQVLERKNLAASFFFRYLWPQ